MIYLTTVLALPDFFDFFYSSSGGISAWDEEHYGSFVCSIDGVDAAINLNPVWEEWNFSYPKENGVPTVVHLQGQDRALRIDAIYKPHDEYTSGVRIVLEVDFWVGNADGSDMQKWNYMRLEAQWVKTTEQHYGYWNIDPIQNDVADPEIDSNYPGEYKCRNVATEYLKQ